MFSIPEHHTELMKTPVVHLSTAITAKRQQIDRFNGRTGMQPAVD